MAPPSRKQPRLESADIFRVSSPKPLSLESVTLNAYGRVEDHLRRSSKGFHVVCAICNKYRKLDRIDPGELPLDKPTCEELGKTCDDEVVKCEGTLEAVGYVPGSFVFAPSYLEENYAAAMVDFSPETSSKYVVMSGGRPIFYFVTFIKYRLNEQRVGGWFPPGKLYHCKSKIRPQEWRFGGDYEMAQETELLDELYSYTLRERLEKYSFVLSKFITVRLQNSASFRPIPQFLPSRLERENNPSRKSPVRKILDWFH